MPQDYILTIIQGKLKLIPIQDYTKEQLTIKEAARDQERRNQLAQGFDPLLAISSQGKRKIKTSIQRIKKLEKLKRNS